MIIIKKLNAVNTLWAFDGGSVGNANSFNYNKLFASKLSMRRATVI